MNTIVSTSIYWIDNNSEDIKISMSCGKGQLSVSSIFLNQHLLQGEIEGGFKNKVIQKASVLNNAILTIDITVQDVNPQTNATSINVTLTGGKSDNTKKFAETIDKDFGQIHYHITYFLKV